MLRFLFTNQQRSFHQSATRWNYTRTALRRLKKPELVALAGQHKIDSSGTKNDLIDRLLTTPAQQATLDNTTTTTTKTTTTDPVSPTHSEKLTATPPSIQPTTESVDIKPELSNTETPSSSSSSTTSAILTDTTEDTSDEGYDQQWVEAFDLKVGNRRSGLERAPKTRQQQDNNKHRPSSAAATSSSAHPAYIHQTVGVDPANTNPNLISMSAHRPTADDPKPLKADDDEPLDPEINQHWVKVFDQRVKTRTKIMGLNTLDIDPKMPSTTITEPPSPTSESTGTKSTGNKAISMAVGTSLAAWYFLGGDGIQAAFSSFFS